MIGSIVFSVIGLAAITALSVSFYVALPKNVLACAERHGRFLGLQGRETLTEGTRVGEPPIGRGEALQVG
jgi:hypothetical protein